MKKFLVLLLIIVMAFNITPVFAQGETKMKVNFDDVNIVYSGRWYKKTDGMYGGWQPSVKFKFTGTSLTINGVGSVFVKIDGQEPIDFTLSSATKIVEGLASGEHNVLIMPQKYTDAITIKGITIDAGAKIIPNVWVPTIECIGDSQTAGGYQNDVGSPFLVKLGYPYILEQKLGWNVYSVAQSGIPLTKIEGKKAPMSEIYDYWSFREADKVNKNKALPTNPDYIICMLGSNDWPGEVTNDAWGQVCKTFISHICDKYPNAVVFVTVSFNCARRATVQSVVSSFNNDKVVFVDTTVWGFEKYRISDNCHFGEEGNDFIANKFYDAIMSYISTHPMPTATATPQPTEEVTVTPTLKPTATQDPSITHSLEPNKNEQENNESR